MCTGRISWECARLGLCHSLWVGILKILEIETKSPIGRLVLSTNLDQRRLLPGAAILSYLSCENITPSKKHQITKYIGKSSGATIKGDTTDDERRWCQWRLKSPSEQLKQKVGIAGGVGKSLLHPLKKHIWEEDEDDHEDEDIESFAPINETHY